MSLELLIIACADIGLVVLALGIFVLPFTCASRCYPNEPVPRIVQLGFPTLTNLPFSMFVKNTVLMNHWYVASISQYGGARGTTASKILALATCGAGVFQFVLAVLIWQIDEHLTRFILLIIGAFGCGMIGFAESAILWKYGQEEQIRTLWATMKPERRNCMIRAILEVYQNMIPPTDAEMGKPIKDKLIAHPGWKVDAAQPFVLDEHDTRYQMSQPLRAVLKESDIRKFITELSQITNTAPEFAPAAFIAYVRFERDGADLEFNGSSPDVVLEDDSRQKSVYANIHMVSALLLIFTNLIAHLLGDHIPSTVLAIVGVVAFFAFCIMQLLSGNYGEYTKCCSPCCYCPQTQPETYGKCGKKTLSSLFIWVEILAFGCIIIATPIEAIVISLNLL